MKDCLDITVFISPGPDGTFAVRAASDAGGQGHATLRLPFALRDLSDAVFGVSETTRAMGSIKAARRDDAAASKSAADFGAELFEALFQGDVREILVATENSAASSDMGVRIRLSMDLQAPGMAAVASLPWELMCRKGQRPRVVSTLSPLVRSLDVPRPTNTRMLQGTLRILVLMSSPTGTAALNLERERAQIEQTWAKLLSVKVDFVRAVRADVLQHLAQHDYHVIHYMGHGDFEASEGGMLLLERADGSPDPISGDEFAMWLADEPLQLVFLNACKTGTTAERSGTHPFAGVATALIRDRVPAVVAMQFPISDQAALDFAQVFYQRIAQGFPVDAAVAEGRKVLYSSKHAEWATPVLYLRAKDGRLFGTLGTDTGSARATAHPATATVAPGPADDPWGAGAADGLRVFLASTDQDREKLRTQIAQALRALDGVRVVDALPQDDNHAAATLKLVERADLCIHLLGANAGRRLDVDDEKPLRTYPLVELDFACEAARSQLVLITSEDKDSIGNRGYAQRVEELASLPRDQARFELVVASKIRIIDAVQTKVEALKAAQRSAVAPVVTRTKEARTALVDSHVNDQDRALDLLTFLEDRNVNTELRTSSGAAIADFAQLDQAVKNAGLYVIVAGNVDRDWVKNRRLAIMKAGVKSRLPLLVAKYSPASTDGAEAEDPSAARLDISTLNDSDRTWVDALFTAETGGKA